jgi:hypothetical protein
VVSILVVIEWFLIVGEDGDLYVYFQVSAPAPLIDGLQYLEPESSYRPMQDLEVHETRFGFIPGTRIPLPD